MTQRSPPPPADQPPADQPPSDQPPAEGDRPPLPSHLTASEVFALTGLDPTQILDLVDAGLLRIDGRGVSSESLAALWRRMRRDAPRG